MFFKPKPKLPVAPLKLDLGCGTDRKDGFLGIDRRAFDGVAATTDLKTTTWVFSVARVGDIELEPVAIGGYKLPDSCVAEAYCSHFLEHLEHNQGAPERVRFMNELWRVLVPGGIATVITPHWASSRQHGDFTHADKPVSEAFYPYLDKSWRMQHAPDNDGQYHPEGYTCDFRSEIGHTVHPDVKDMGPDERSFALKWYKDAAWDLHAKLTAVK